MDKKPFFIVFLMLPFIFAFQNHQEITAEKWKEVEIILLSSAEYDNPYTDVDVYVLFSGPDNTELKRPAFWDGENRWKVR